MMQGKRKRLASRTVERLGFSRLRLLNPSAQTTGLGVHSWEQAVMNVTRRVAMKAGLGTALSALGLPALRADELRHRTERSVAMSHHLDTPLASQNGQLYIDDLYVFQGDGSTVFIMDVNSNVTEVHIKPGFHHEARYEFKVHFDEPITKA
jgi:hypothetical protein